MQIDSKILDDLVGLLTGATGTAMRMRKDFEHNLRAQFEKILSSFDIVSREEFDSVKKMAAKAREEQELLNRRIAELEKRLDAK